MSGNINEEDHDKIVGQVVKCGTKIELKLKEIGATGKGLFELFKSIEDDFSKVEKNEFYFLLRERNKHSHEDNYKMKNFDNFRKKCNSFIAYINQRIANKKRIEEQEREQKRIKQKEREQKRIKQKEREQKRIKQKEREQKRNKIIFIFIFGVIILGILFYSFKNSKKDIINEISSYQKNENHYITKQIDLSKKIITLSSTIKQKKDQQNFLRNLFNDTDEIDKLEEKLDNLKEEKDTLEEKIKDTKENIKDLQNKL